MNGEELKFDLVQPKDVIDQYIKIWNDGCIDENKDIDIFSNVKIDISDYKCIYNKKYNDYDDKEIKPCFDNLYKDRDDIEVYRKAVEKVDSIYNTMLNKKRDVTAANIFANREEIFRKIEIIKNCNENGDIRKKLVDYIACINKESGGSYIYSFATKFCSFMLEDTFPIFDSIVSTLVWKYLKEKGIKCSHDKMGDYGYYLDRYSDFINQYDLEGYTYKNIDVFLWLYGKIMTEYWEKIGVIRFSSVYYKSPK